MTGRKMLAYKDTGCKLNPTCLDCPISTDECPLFTPGGIRKYVKKEKISSIRILHQEGKTTTELTKIFNVSRSTIQRATHNAK